MLLWHGPTLGKLTLRFYPTQGSFAASRYTWVIRWGDRWDNLITWRVKTGEKVTHPDLDETGVLRWPVPPSWARSEVLRFPAELGLKPERGVRMRPPPTCCFGVYILNDDLWRQILHLSAFKNLKDRAQESFWDNISKTNFKISQFICLLFEVHARSRFGNRQLLSS